MSAARGAATKYLHSAAGRRDAAVRALRDQQVALERRCSRQREREHRLNAELTRFRNGAIDVLASTAVPEAAAAALARLDDALRFHLAEPHKLPEKLKRARLRLEAEHAGAVRSDRTPAFPVGDAGSSPAPRSSPLTVGGDAES